MEDSNKISKIADEWLRLGASIEKLERVAIQLERLISHGGNIQPSPIPKDKKEETTKEKLQFINSILKLGENQR
jgi:hypothetical protein